MNPQHIIDVCEAKWEANKSDCNHFVKAVADALGVNLFAPSDNADVIMNKLANASDWTLVPDLSTVEQDASAGQFLVAGLKSGEFNPPRNNGHVVVVVKGDDPSHPGFPMAYWGKLNGVGAKNSSIRNSFRPDVDLPNVKYYATSLAVSFTRLSAELDTTSLSDAKATTEGLIEKIVTSLSGHSGSDPKQRLFFPSGIEDVEVEVKAGPVELKVKVAGPKGSSR